ncbi:MAG: hypothetical protein M3O50_00520 [Myxococcota bacterium]|nr:hypothetical protein [Myxococcota bacterium]
MATLDPRDPLGRALDEAVAGRQGRLFDLLARGSHLPGTRMNAPLAEAFAAACRSRGARADPVALALARLSAAEAPGATSLEFLPVCGVAALGSRAAADKDVRGAFLLELHARADDLRFRVRDAVVDSLARIGEAAGDALAVDVTAWMDGYFHAGAVVRALARETWLSTLHDGDVVAARVDEALALARDAPRAAARWPGHKALLDALSTSLVPVVIRFGAPMFDLLERWSVIQDPALREVIAGLLSAPKLAGRFGKEMERVRRSLKTSLPAPRNPDHDVGPTRDRSRRRREGNR